MAPREATRASLETITKGENTIAITGNVLRDYLTDLFPILELATSAKMLSIVKLMQGGGLFETGAGGSAPKHVQQLQEENHLRWDSLGEFCALGESLKFLADAKGNARAAVLGEAVEAATQGILDNGRSPSRKVGEPDNRDSHYWFARYWAEALAAQSDDAALAEEFGPIAAALAENEAQITGELAAAQGAPADTGGYYTADADKAGRGHAAKCNPERDHRLTPGRNRTPPAKQSGGLQRPPFFGSAGTASLRQHIRAPQEAENPAAPRPTPKTGRSCPAAPRPSRVRR